MGPEKITRAIRVFSAVMVVVAAGCSGRLAKPVGEASAQRSDSLRDVETAIHTFEGLEASGKTFFAAPPEMRNEEANRAAALLDNAAVNLAAYLKSHPEDTKALLLKARLLRAQDAKAPRTFTGGPDGVSLAGGEPHTADINNLLDTVLSREPGNAEAHYWKARVTALQEPVIKEGKLSYEGGDVEKVLNHASRAVQAAPGNLVYREYLAQALIAAGRPEEAMDLLKDVAGGSHPINRLLSDWKLIPLPEGAVVDVEMTASAVQMAMASEDAASFPNLRIAIFAVPRPLVEIVAFYRSRWASIREPDTGDRSYQLLLDWKGTDLVPVEAPPADEESLPGVLIRIDEFSDERPELREALKLKEGMKGCSLMVINYRGHERSAAPRGKTP